MTTSISRRVKLLDKKLLELTCDDAMLLSELDGFLAGIIVSPDTVMPSQWMPLIWGENDDDAVLGNSQQIEQLVGLILEHYNATIKDIAKNRYQPIFNLDPVSGETLWEIWIEGFIKAYNLSPQGWKLYKTGDIDTQIAIKSLLFLDSVAKSSITDETINRSEELNGLPSTEELNEIAPDLIAEYIPVLDEARKKNYDLEQDKRSSPFMATQKTGRNEPCPCGSGKKYKKCCGLN